MKKTSQITLKLTDDDFEFLKDIAEQTDFSAQAIARQMIAAVRRQWEATGRLSLPLTLAADTPTPEEDAAKARRAKK